MKDDRILYVYRLRNKITKEFYYGCKYGKDANLKTFWIDYFTSSTYIHERIEEYGKDSFETKIVKVGFETPGDCLHYEGKLIMRTWRNELSMNYRYHINYCGVNDEIVAKMLETRNTPDEDGITSYQRGGAKRKETVMQNGGYEPIIEKGKNTCIDNGWYDELSERYMGVGVGNNKELICQHCGKTMKSSGNFSRWHGDMCAENPNLTKENKQKRVGNRRGSKVSEFTKQLVSNANKGKVTCWDTKNNIRIKVSKAEFDNSPHLVGNGSKGTPEYKKKYNKGN